MHGFALALCNYCSMTGTASSDQLDDHLSIVISGALSAYLCCAQKTNLHGGGRRQSRSCSGVEDISFNVLPLIHYFRLIQGYIFERCYTMRCA